MKVKKNSKYFLSLEKRHCKQKTIFRLKNNNAEELTSDKEILTECKNFYRNLYTSKKADSIDVQTLENKFFPEGAKIQISEEEKSYHEGLISSEECLKAIKQMQPGKSPGTDGLPVEFYKVFWNDISAFVVNSINTAYQKGMLSVTQRRGIHYFSHSKERQNIISFKKLAALFFS